MGVRGRTVLGMVLIGALGACGSGDGPQPTGAPMGGVQAHESENRAAATRNERPVIESVALRPSTPRPGQHVRAIVEVSDPDGERVKLGYEWKVDGRKVAGGSSLRLDNVKKGAFIELRVVAHDRSSVSEAATATARVGNQTPVLLGVVIEPLGEVTVRHDVVASPRATDLDGDELEYEYLWRVNGARRNIDGAVLPKNEFRRGDEIELTVVASDGLANSEPLRSQPFAVGNAPPRITSEPGGLDDRGWFHYQVVAEDPDDGSKLFYRLRQAPNGMKLDVVSGLVTWEPREDQTGRHPVVLEVADRAGGKDTQSFELRLDLAPDSTPAAPAP